MMVKLQSGLVVNLDDELAKSFINTGRAQPAPTEAPASEKKGKGKKK